MRSYGKRIILYALAASQLKRNSADRVCAVLQLKTVN